jgi:hypothetical protein
VKAELLTALRGDGAARVLYIAQQILDTYLRG